jgi:hypothetical protein
MLPRVRARRLESAGAASTASVPSVLAAAHLAAHLVDIFWCHGAAATAAAVRATRPHARVAEPAQ